MKVPALRAELGGRVYYVATLTFGQVSEYVSPINDQLHKSETLNDLIQRSISKNYLNIKEYILNQPELFFNSLVLAVYNNYPDWTEIEVQFDDNTSSYQLGMLDFPGNHKIFPIDGQHRVEGIKAALKERPNLQNQQIAAIFIGHKNDEAGMLKTRRLFTTLNRYAKPVSLDDIIALDEDDIVAITTRYLLEEYGLFSGKRIVVAKQKGIPNNNKDAMTSVITLYQANVELFKSFYTRIHNSKPTEDYLVNYLKFRPSEEEIEKFQTFILSFWDAFRTELSFIGEYLNKNKDFAKDFRNNKTGGNLVFRPIGFLPLVKAALKIYSREVLTFKEVFKKFNSLNFNLDQKPWLYVLWNPIENTMLTNSDILTQLLLLYLAYPKILNEQEKNKLKNAYGAKISYKGNIEDTLKEITS